MGLTVILGEQPMISSTKKGTTLTIIFMNDMSIKLIADAARIKRLYAPFRVPFRFKHTHACFNSLK